MSIVYFPLDCSRTKVTMSFGFPYPYDRKISGVHKDYFYFLQRFFSDNSAKTAIENSLGRSLNMNLLADRVLALQALRTRPDLISLSFYKRVIFNQSSAFQKITSHHGVDLAYPGNTGNVEVRSICEGRVLVAASSWCGNRNCGGFLVVRHVFGKTQFYALYGHVTPVVSSGSNVKAGQIIGLTSTGMSNMNPHLHLEISYNEKSLTTKYPPYPYNQYFLNIQFLSTYFYPHSGNTITISSNLYGSFLTRKGIFLNSVGDYSKSSLSLNSPWNRYYGIIDPISFLQELCPNRVRNPVDDSVCGNLERLEESTLTFSI